MHFKDKASSTEHCKHCSQIVYTNSVTMGMSRKRMEEPSSYWYCTLHQSVTQQEFSYRRFEQNVFLSTRPGLRTTNSCRQRHVQEFRTMSKDNL